MRLLISKSLLVSLSTTSSESIVTIGSTCARCFAARKNRQWVAIGDRPEAPENVLQQGARIQNLVREKRCMDGGLPPLFDARQLPLPRPRQGRPPPRI